MSLSYKIIQSPVGKLKLVASDKGLVAILWENDNPRRVLLKDMAVNERHPILLETQRQLGEYFAGERSTFSVALDTRGTQRACGTLCSESPSAKPEATDNSPSNSEIRAHRERLARRTEEIQFRSSCPVVG